MGWFVALRKWARHGAADAEQRWRAPEKGPALRRGRKTRIAGAQRARPARRAAPRRRGAPARAGPYGGSPPRASVGEASGPRATPPDCAPGQHVLHELGPASFSSMSRLSGLYVAPDAQRERADSMGSLGSLNDTQEHHATISPRTPPGLTARPRGSSVDNVIPGTPPRSQPLTQEVPATPPSRRPLARVNSPTGVGGMAALMTASEQVQNTDVVSLVNAGRIVEAAQAAGTVYGPPPRRPHPTWTASRGTIRWARRARRVKPQR